MTQPVNEQVVVITGASSGIGRAAALEFGRRGAKLVLAARNGEALHDLAAEIGAAGGEAQVVVTDVARREDVDRLAAEAVTRFGRIDTWVNNAAVVVYGTVLDTPVEEMEQIIQVNLLGQIYGMKAVLPPMIAQGHGTIINVASVEAERALPYHAAYSASKHGVKGFTEALRVELAHDHLEIQVTLILPGSINTPLFNHARSRLGVKPLPMPPVYEPETVAAAIVSAAEQPQRDIYVGSFSRLLTLLERLSPGVVDRMFLTGDMAFRFQKTAEPDNGRDNLFGPLPERGAVQGDFSKLAKPVSLYTQLLELHPQRKWLLLGATAAGAAILLRRGRH